MNYKILENLLPEVGNRTFELQEVFKIGFNENCFFGTQKSADGSSIRYFIYDYTFTIKATSIIVNKITII